MLRAAEVIALLHLKPLPLEGGFYRETYRASARLPGEPSPSLSTAIYYLLTPDTCSALHRLPTDEVYHFYLGGPVELLMLLPSGASQVVVLGNDLQAGQQPQWVVPAGVWQGSRLLPGADFALLGTTMAPGFEFSDYEAGAREPLLNAYADQSARIVALTAPK